jgi:integrase
MLSEAITRYVALHRAMGFKFNNQDRLLRNFATFAEPRGDGYVHTETVLAWAAQAPSAAQRRGRLLVVRRFAQHMQAEDKRYEVPPAYAFGRAKWQQRMPHIYTPEEIRLLLQAAAQLTPVGSIRPTTYVTLFALIASTGLRISEALALQLDHITPAGLRIEQTKFRKSRLVPLHPTSRQGLDRYLARRRQVGGTSRSLFISLWGTGLAYSTVYPVFLELMRSIGLRGGPGRPGPCIHDLRHTFAVRVLETCTGGEEEIGRQILALATYLGHTHPSDTYYYLQATPKLLEGIARAGEQQFQKGGRP